MGRFQLVVWADFNSRFQLSLTQFAPTSASSYYLCYYIMCRSVFRSQLLGLVQELSFRFTCVIHRAIWGPHRDALSLRVWGLGYSESDMSRNVIDNALSLPGGGPVHHVMECLP